MPASRSSASSSSKAIGSSDTLPLVITSGTPTSASSRWCSGEYGSITPRSRERGRHAGGDAARRRGAARRRSAARGERSGRCSPAVSSTSASAAASASRTMSANGRSSRCLRARSARHGRLVVGAAGEVEAADALDRDDRRRRAARAPRDRFDRRPASAARGPQAGHAFGWAWKRRSRGSSYSARHAAHIAKPAIVVERPVVRDAGDDREPRAAVGAVDERVAVAPVAPDRTARRRHASQVAASARDRRVGPRRRAGSRGSRTRARPPPAPARNDSDSTDASGGASTRSRARNASTALRPRPRPPRPARR